MLHTSMTTLPLLLLALSPFVISDSAYALIRVCSVSPIPFAIFL